MRIACLTSLGPCNQHDSALTQKNSEGGVVRRAGDILRRNLLGSYYDIGSMPCRLNSKNSAGLTADSASSFKTKSRGLAVKLPDRIGFDSIKFPLFDSYRERAQIESC